jgi:exosome complex component RRP4
MGRMAVRDGGWILSERRCGRYSYRPPVQKVIAAMETDRIVLPGDVIERAGAGLQCGSGVAQRGDAIVATVRGFVTRMSRLLSVAPMTSIYTPNVGDVVVGRIAQVQQQRWKVQIGCSVLALLRLTSIYLPDDQLRRRTTADERNMRQYFDVGDLVCAEVQEVPSGGGVSLHTRQQHPRRLDRGAVVDVPARLIKRVPTHICALERGGAAFQVIWGVNGAVWVAPADAAGAALLPRIRNCIVLLATYQQQISTDALCAVFERTQRLAASRIATPDGARAVGIIR